MKIRLLLIFLISTSFILVLLFKTNDITISTHQIQVSSLPKLQRFPIKTDTFTQPPQITSMSAIVVDSKTGVSLFEKDPNVKHLPASTTKLMTALVALEKCSSDQEVRVGDVISVPTLMGLQTGDNVTVLTLLYGLLVSSGNDAAHVLSYSCAPSTEMFVKEMNQKAKELSMASTHFANPAGFDDQTQYTTAKDLAKLAQVAVGNPLISKIVGTKSIVVTDVLGSKTYYLENINKLLGEVAGLEGVKTGQTAGSLEILVSKTTRNGNTIITVILGSKDRFEESKQLIEWAFANYKWIEPD